MMRGDAVRRGFTLIELVVALAITGLVLLLAHGMFTVATDGVRELKQAREAADRSGNAHDWLRDAFLSLDVGQQGDVQFDGHADRLRFTTWLLTPHGWAERFDIRLRLRDSTFTAAVGPDERIPLYHGVTSAAFDYLLEPGVDTRWAAEWVSPVSAPVAVRVRITTVSGADTILYLVKSRG
jgi:prepilin-type N-terminal cleavage/methylation domain-containing protein